MSVSRTPGALKEPLQDVEIGCGVLGLTHQPWRASKRSVFLRKWA
jgi:hypothetical protein